MMKLLRLAAILVLLVVVALGAGAVLLVSNQDSLMARVMAGVRERTGLQITAAGTHLRLSSHLILEFDHPQISLRGRELGRFESVRAVVNYHSILTGGVPLHALILVRPEMQLPPNTSFAITTPLPKAGTELVNNIIDFLHQVEQAAWQVEAIDATVRTPDGNILFDDVGVLAYRRHRQRQVWRVNLSVRVVQRPFAGLRFTGRFRVGINERDHSHQLAAVSLWFWNDSINQFRFSSAHADGRLSGSARFSLSDDGSAEGAAKVGLIGVTVTGNGAPPQKLGDYTGKIRFSESSDALRIENLRLFHDQTELGSGDVTLSGLSRGDKASLTAHFGANQPIDMDDIRSNIRYLQNVPATVTEPLQRIQSARLLLNNVTLATTPQKLRDTPEAAVRDGIDLTASVSETAFLLPDDLKLPPVHDLSAVLRYAKNTMSMTQGSAKLDDSSLQDVSARFDFARNFASVGYQLKFAGDASMDQLYPAIRTAMDRFKVEPANTITGLSGRVAFEADASGVFKAASPSMPDKFHARFEANRATVVTKSAPGPLEFTSGSISIDPGTLRFEKLRLRTTGGDGLVDGSLGVDRSGAKVRDVTVELHEMPAGLWLALAVNPDSLNVDGPIGGKVHLRADPRVKDGILADGKLVMKTGKVQFGFLRSPMLVQGATVTLNGRSMAIAMPSSTLEGSPLDFEMSIADLDKPTLRIDANAQRLDFEVLRFIRLPWTPSTPPVIFPIPVNGHVNAQKANLSKLPMTAVSTDFWRVNGDWKVSNFRTNAFNGTAELEISGRAKDDWIHINGKVANMDVAPMFLLPGTRKESPIVGKIWVAADLDADTNSDFFETLGGRTSITLRDGYLNRFKLLSRMLELIDLKSWLTAKIDPDIEGLPYQRILFDLSGDKGVFTTENFILQGPIMEITANGEVNFAQSTIDMKLAAFPLSTLNWAMSKIPLVGNNLSGAAGTVVAAYFYAHGPVSDPSVAPMPITSAVELVKKMIFLPVNMIRPNTVK